MYSTSCCSAAVSEALIIVQLYVVWCHQQTCCYKVDAGDKGWNVIDIQGKQKKAQAVRIYHQNGKTQNEYV